VLRRAPAVGGVTSPHSICPAPCGPQAPVALPEPIHAASPDERELSLVPALGATMTPSAREASQQRLPLGRANEVPCPSGRSDVVAKRRVRSVSPQRLTAASSARRSVSTTDRSSRRTVGRLDLAAQRLRPLRGRRVQVGARRARRPTASRNQGHVGFWGRRRSVTISGPRSGPVAIVEVGDAVARPRAFSPVRRGSRACCRKQRHRGARRREQPRGLAVSRFPSGLRYGSACRVTATCAPRSAPGRARRASDRAAGSTIRTRRPSPRVADPRDDVGADESESARPPIHRPAYGNPHGPPSGTTLRRRIRPQGRRGRAKAANPLWNDEMAMRTSSLSSRSPTRVNDSPSSRQASSVVGPSRTYFAS